MTKYSSLEQILNEQFLGDNELSKFLYQRNFLNKKEIKTRKIFITGLARSGTTALLNQILKEDYIASIQYKHMPFVLSPRMANWFGRFNSNESEKERLHGDGILISQNSPECLDEPFWIKSDNDYHNKLLALEKNKSKINIGL